MSGGHIKKLRILSPIHRATRQIHMYLEREVGVQDVSTSEGHLLTYLLSYEPAPICELLRVFGFKRSTMTSMLDRLEKARLLKRMPNAEDRRSWLVKLSSDGRKKAREIRKLVDRFESTILDRLTPEALEGFQQVIDTIGEITAVEVRGRS